MIATPQLQTPSLSTSASQDGDNDLNDDEDVEDSTPSAARGGVYALVKPLVDGSVELRAFRTNSDANFCFQAPVVVTKSSTSPPNAVCPPKWAKLSCSCVARLPSNTHWDLRVAKRSASEAVRASVASVASATDAIPVTSIGIFILPNNVASLRLAGDSAAQPLSVDLRLMYHTNKESASASQLVLTAPKSVLKSVEVVNIDLSSIDIAGGFLPASLTSISLQQCKIAALTPDFLAERHQTLQTLNLTGNQLRTFDAAVPSGEMSAIRSIDLSNNRLSGIPPSLTSLVKLTRLNLRGNPISSFSVSVDQFAQLASLVSFQVDAPAPRASSAMDTACSSGTLQSTAGVQFCVIRGGGAASSTPPGSSSSSGTFVALYIGVGIPVLVAVVTLVAFLTWKRRRTTSDVVDKADSFDISLLERTESPNSCVLEVDRSLLADPILAAHRLPFGDVAVGECISQGGFGVVYAGVYKSQRVAVKRIRAGQHRDVRRIETFLREICLMASLAHPRIVQFVGVAWGDSLRSLSAVTELMARGDLRHVLQSDKKQPRGPATRLSWAAHKLRIALHVAEALAYLHALQPAVVHRDLKSKNILLSAALDAKLSDFGISRERSEAASCAMTAGVGTAFWIAPEVLLGQRYGERADVFSFGVVLSELDTGEYPYWDVPGGARGKESEVLRLVAAGALRPLLSPECPRGVALLAEHCLQREPERRPSSAHVAHFLARLLRAAGAVDAEGSGASVEAEGDSASPRSAMSVDSFFDESLLVRTATPQ